MDSSGGPLIGSVIYLILLLADFILNGYGTALQTVSESALEQACGDEKQKAEQILELKNNPGNFVYASWFYLIGTASGGTFLLRKAWSDRPAWMVLTLSMVLLFLFAKAVPELLGKKYANAWCRSLLSPIKGLVLISRPATYVLTLAAHLLVRILGVDFRELEDEVTEDEIISMVNEGHEQGVLDEHEAEMIQNIFELDDKEAQDIMTHRKNISGISGCINLSEAISVMVNETNSRFPVYEGDIDNIIGVLHFKDAMIFHNKNQYDQWLIKDIPGLLRPVNFIPETRSISLLFRSMQAQKMQMVIVVDEYGETAGLVTMEDILEEIVGNILDEYDKDESFILTEEDGSWRMDGMTPLSDAEDTLGIHFQEEEYDTLNGYLIYRLDRIPEEDEHSVIEEQGYAFRILAVENKTIKWVKVTRLPREESGRSQTAEENEQQSKREDTIEKE